MAMHLEHHPLSHYFEWPTRTQQDDLLISAHIDDWNEKGYFLLEDALGQRILDEVEEAIDPIEAKYEAHLKANGGEFGISKADALTFTAHVVKRSETLKRFALSQVFASLCLNLIGDNARLYWDQAVYKKPGNPEEFPWHQDNGYSFVLPQTYLTCWVPLNDATVDNGCPWVLPGVHREGTLKHKPTRLGFQCVEDPGEVAQPIEAKRGDIVVFSSLTPHRTGPNLTSDVRKAYILQYCHGVSEVVTPDGKRIQQNDESRQFSIVQDGRFLA